MRSTVTRRQFLAGATVLGTAAMAGCSPGSPSHSSGSPGTTPPAAAAPGNPDQLLLRAAVEDMKALLASAHATSQAHRALAERVRPLTRVLNRQLTVLGAAQPGERPTSRTTGPSEPARMLDDPTSALAALRHGANRAAAARLDDTSAAASGRFARVLSAIAAGLSEQVVRLGGPTRLAAVPAGGLVAPTEARRLQQALSAEHAAVYAYGVIGARGGPSRLGLSHLAYTVHLERRDVLTSMIQTSGVTPTAALPGYELPDQITGPAAVARFARTVELRCCQVYAQSVSETTTEARGFCALVQTSCGNWSVAWGNPTQPFPGAPEL